MDRILNMFTIGGQSTDNQPAKTTEVKINGTTINVEVADTNDKRSRGLSGRDGLEENSGMLFVYPAKDSYRYWMKGMKFSIDFIWIDGNRVVEVYENAQPPAANQSDSDLAIYTPKVPLDKILEVKAGFVRSHNIKVGDSVEVANP